MTDELRAETIRIAENARQYRRVLEQMVADARSRPPDPTLAVAVSVDMLALLLDDLAATGTDGEAQPRTPYGVVPANCRLILASDNLLDEWGTRTERGERITAEWGEPSPEGWYEPVFTVHSDDVLQHWPAAIRAGAPDGAET